jgi:putative heme-binding domain-containing protein
LRAELKSGGANTRARQHAFEVLSKAQDREALPEFIALLDDNAFRQKAIPVLARFDAPEVAGALISRIPNLSIDDRNGALNALTSRANYAKALLEAIAKNQLKRDYVTAFHVRQMTQLRDPELEAAVTQAWGRFNSTAAEKEKQIAALEKIFNEAPLWAYDGRAGRQHFQTLCASCHKLGDDGQRLGPELTGAGKHGIRYYLENTIDPNAVIGADFQMTTVETRDGDVISGLLINESADALTIRTVASEEKVAKADIERRQTSEKSLMPEGLLDTLGERERIELLKFLTSH